MPEVNIAKINGIERAAILLLSLGETDAAAVLRHMGPKEVQKVGSVMATLSNVSKDQVAAVLQDFADLSGHQVYACGAPVVVESARQDYSALAGLPPEEFFADSFTTEADKARAA